MWDAEGGKPPLSGRRGSAPGRNHRASKLWMPTSSPQAGASAALLPPAAALACPAVLCCAVRCCAVQLRIGAVIRRDGAPDNPNFPGAPALPCAAVGAQALEIAKGERSDEIIRIA